MSGTEEEDILFLQLAVLLKLNWKKNKSKKKKKIRSSRNLSQVRWKWWFQQFSTWNETGRSRVFSQVKLFFCFYSMKKLVQKWIDNNKYQFNEIEFLNNLFPSIFANFVVFIYFFIFIIQTFVISHSFSKFFLFLEAKYVLTILIS